MDIEGSAYVTRNSSVPLYSLIVLNKKGAADLILHIEENLEKIQIQDQYIMIRCRNEDGKVILGIWIHDKADRDRFYGSILRTKEFRKNSLDVTTLLSRYVLRSKSTQVPVEESAIPTSVTFSSILQPSPSSFDAQNSSSVSTTITASVSTPIRAENKSSALLSLLKPAKDSMPSVSALQTPSTPFSNDITLISSSGIASLDEIIERPESSAVVGSNLQASARLLSLLSGSKSASNAALDFPTDVQISAKSKQLSSSVASSPIRVQVSTTSTVDPHSCSTPPRRIASEALKAALSLPLTASSSATTSPLASPLLRSSAPYSDLTDNPSLTRSPTELSTNGIAVLQNALLKEVLLSSLSQAPSRAKSAPSAASPTMLPASVGSVNSFVAERSSTALSSSSAKKPVKLISPSDLGELY
jgi:hypothetical protein